MTERHKQLFNFISQIEDISDKDHYSIEAANTLKNIEIKVSNFEKAVIESLSGISYPYGMDIPEPLRNIIKDIQI